MIIVQSLESLMGVIYQHFTIYPYVVPLISTPLILLFKFTYNLFDSLKKKLSLLFKLNSIIFKNQFEIITTLF